MTVVCFGDSITAAQHVPEGSGWVELLGWINKGISGDTTRLGLERFPRDVQKSGADMVLIQFGHNDANRWQTDRGHPRVSLAAYTANLTEMVARARLFDIEPVIIGLSNPDRDRAYVFDCQTYNEASFQVAKDTRTVWCPMWPHLTSAHYLADGLHLNEDGHHLYADRVASLVRISV